MHARFLTFLCKRIPLARRLTASPIRPGPRARASECQKVTFVLPTREGGREGRRPPACPPAHSHSAVVSLPRVARAVLFRRGTLYATVASMRRAINALSDENDYHANIRRRSRVPFLSRPATPPFRARPSVRPSFPPLHLALTRRAWKNDIMLRCTPPLHRAVRVESKMPRSRSFVRSFVRAFAVPAEQMNLSRILFIPFIAAQQY